MAIPRDFDGVFSAMDFMDVRSYVYSKEMFELFRTGQRKTLHNVEKDVAKLRSVSKAGRAWIVDARCYREQIGPYDPKRTGTYRFPLTKVWQQP